MLSSLNRPCCNLHVRATSTGGTLLQWCNNTMPLNLRAKQSWAFLVGEDCLSFGCYTFRFAPQLCMACHS